ncbi:MAG: lysophospholipase [Clostridia bacterium]|nr:lysophospholipase [Clostridia bacterium]
MIQKETFTFTSPADGTKLYAVRYRPETPVAILQIAHGMCEYIERYEDFARYLAANGYLVVGNDHRGHGNSAQPENYGYFAEKDGNDALLADLHELNRLTREQYPDLPVFLLGHSMGSFYARQYLYTYREPLAGAIVMGTGHQPRALVRAGKLLTKLGKAIFGDHYRWKLVNNMAFGSYNKAFAPGRTPYDWLTKDEAIVDAYMAEPRCTFMFTLNGYYNMFTGIDRLHDKARLAQMPKDLPVLFVAGDRDPVGDFGKGVQAAAESFRQAGISEVTVKLYEDDRHEILNETDREIVYADILNWLEAHRP